MTTPIAAEDHPDAYPNVGGSDLKLPAPLWSVRAVNLRDFVRSGAPHNIGAPFFRPNVLKGANPDTVLTEAEVPNEEEISGRPRFRTMNFRPRV